MQHLDKATAHEGLGMMVASFHAVQFWTWAVLVLTAFFIGKYIYYLKAHPDLPERRFFKSFIVFVLCAIGLLAYHNLFAMNALQQTMDVWLYALQNCDALMCKKN